MEHDTFSEDRLIRRILLGAATLGVLAFLGFALLVTAMISYNFNFLNWME